MKINITITNLSITIEDAPTPKAAIRALRQTLDQFIDEMPLANNLPAAEGPLEIPDAVVDALCEELSSAPPVVCDSLPDAVVFPAPAILHRNGITLGAGKPEAPVQGSKIPGKRLPFEEFDRLVRLEMKRLSVAGSMPGHKLWNEQRRAPLPTLTSVLMRYKYTTVAELAAELGFSPPLGGDREGTKDDLVEAA